MIKLKLEVNSDFQRKKKDMNTQINLKLTGKISLEFDFISTCFYNTALNTSM